MLRNRGLVVAIALSAILAVVAAWGLWWGSSAVSGKEEFSVAFENFDKELVKCEKSGKRGEIPTRALSVKQEVVGARYVDVRVSVSELQGLVRDLKFLDCGGSGGRT